MIQSNGLDNYLKDFMLSWACFKLENGAELYFRYGDEWKDNNIGCKKLCPFPWDGTEFCENENWFLMMLVYVLID